MDGVVIDSEKLYAKGEVKLFREYGVEIPDEDWKLFRGCTDDTFYKLSMERYQITEDEKVFRQKGHKYVLEAFENELDYMDGFLDLHKILTNYYQIGLVTASPKDFFKWINKRLHIKQYFPQIITGEMVTNGKPHPEPYLKMIKIMDVQPHECIVVEDSVHGMNSGLSAGTKVIALTGSVQREDMPKVHKIINHLDEITDELISSFK